MFLLSHISLNVSHPSWLLLSCCRGQKQEKLNERETHAHDTGEWDRRVGRWEDGGRQGGWDETRRDGITAGGEEESKEGDAPKWPASALLFSLLFHSCLCLHLHTHIFVLHHFLLSSMSWDTKTRLKSRAGYQTLTLVYHRPKKAGMKWLVRAIIMFTQPLIR